MALSTGLTGVTGLTDAGHRSDRVARVESRASFRCVVREFWFGRLCVALVPRTSSTPMAMWSWPTSVVESETCVGSRIHLVGASISFEKNFYRLPFTPPPLSGSSFRSFANVASMLRATSNIRGPPPWHNTQATHVASMLRPCCVQHPTSVASSSTQIPTHMSAMSKLNIRNIKN
jgi:hypothetical protein